MLLDYFVLWLIKDTRDTVSCIRRNVSLVGLSFSNSRSLGPDPSKVELNILLHNLVSRTRLSFHYLSS